MLKCYLVNNFSVLKTPCTGQGRIKTNHIFTSLGKIEVRNVTLLLYPGILAITHIHLYT